MPVASSLPSTDIVPFPSMLIVISIFSSPFSVFGSSVKANWPSCTFDGAKRRLPWYNLIVLGCAIVVLYLISTSCWLSAVVVKIFFAVTGRSAPLGITTSILPPRTSTPISRGTLVRASVSSVVVVASGT